MQPPPPSRPCGLTTPVQRLNHRTKTFVSSTLRNRCLALGWLGIYIHIHRFVVMSGSLMLNQWRTLVIHRYGSDGEPMGGSAQVHDTVTFSGHALLSGLIAPLGSRFHALHHELPSVPYHALPGIHRQLLNNKAYRETLSPGVIHTWLHEGSRRAQASRRRIPST